MTRERRPATIAVTSGPREVVDAVRRIANGAIDTVHAVTLTPSATTTIVSDGRVPPTAVVVLGGPISASAVAVAPYVSSVTGGDITISHASSAATDMTLTVVWFR